MLIKLRELHEKLNIKNEKLNKIVKRALKISITVVTVIGIICSLLLVLQSTGVIRLSPRQTEIIRLIKGNSVKRYLSDDLIELKNGKTTTLTKIYNQNIAKKEQS